MSAPDPLRGIGSRGTRILVADVELVVRTNRPAALHHGPHAIVVTDEELLIPSLGDCAARHIERAHAALAADDKITPGVEYRATA